MAKTIKFNLILDGQPIRDIKGLQENFCIEDILDFYENGLLLKWLKVRSLNEYLEKVESIKKDESAIIQLIKIFDVKKSEKEIREDVYSLGFWSERKKKLEEWNRKEIKIKNVISEYHHGYDQLLKDVQENKEDMPFLKTAAKEIYDTYLEIFKIDYLSFFERFKEDVPLIIYAVLMNDNLRRFFLEDETIKNTLKTEYTLSKNVVFDIKELETGKLHVFKGKTDSYWKDLEIAKTKVMVLSIPNNTFVRSTNKPKEELSASEVNGEFVILDGLVYKSDNGVKSIIYMEV